MRSRFAGSRQISMKEKMVRFISRVAKKAGIKMAIGGGIAVQSHGYRRETSDVDAFFHYADRQRVLRAVHAERGARLEELDPSHWFVVLPGAAPDERIDLLFATGDPEESAIEMASPRAYGKTTAQVFPIDMLVVSKFLAERNDAKDWLDIYELHRRGAYSIADVSARLTQMGDRDGARRFVAFMRDVEKLTKKKAAGK